MSLTYEIIRAFILVFGVTQVLTNFNYLLRDNGMKQARLQHQELPKEITDQQMKIKVLLMFSFGVIFFTSGLISYFTKSYIKELYIVVCSLFFIYALIETIYYRYIKTYGFMVVSLILLVLIIIF